MNKNTRYEGHCPGCGETVEAFLTRDERELLLPPPVITGIHMCSLPRTEFELVYRG